MSVRVDVLQQLPALQNLPSGILEEFAGSCVPRSFERHALIDVGEGEDGRMLLVLSGTIQLYQTSGGRKAVVQVLRAGDFLGDLSFIHPPMLKGETIAKAQEATRACAFSNQDIGALMERYPQFAMLFVVALRDRLHQAESKIRDLALASAEIRVLNELIRYAVNRGRARDGSYEIGERLTHQALADMTGLTRETVTKTLQFLERHGFISSAPNRLLTLHGKKISKDCVGCLKLQER